MARTETLIEENLGVSNTIYWEDFELHEGMRIETRYGDAEIITIENEYDITVFSAEFGWQTITIDDIYAVLPEVI